MTLAIIVIPVMVAIITQITKALIDLICGRFSFSSFYNYGGMPSGHAAFMTAVVTSVYLFEGPNTSIFALSIILAILVLRDAISLRQHMSKHSQIINKLIKELPDNKEYEYPVLQERIGHSVTQVVAGIATGLLLTLLISLTFYI